MGRRIGIFGLGDCNFLNCIAQIEHRSHVSDDTAPSDP